VECTGWLYLSLSRKQINTFVGNNTGFGNDRPIATLKLVLENPGGIIAMEDAEDAANTPVGARVNVFLTPGWNPVSSGDILS